MYKTLIQLSGSSVNLLRGCLDSKKLSYMERLHLLDLPSHELRRLHIDLIWCYKIIFGLVHINCKDFFSFEQKSTRGHCYKLCKQTNHTNTRFFFLWAAYYKSLE